MLTSRSYISIMLDIQQRCRDIVQDIETVIENERILRQEGAGESGLIGHCKTDR